MSDFKSRLEQCVITFRGEIPELETIFHIHDETIECNLYRYAIVPLEDYGKYVDDIAEALKEFKAGGEDE